MKRNVNLQELSRDHHHGLLLGWKIRQGLKYDVSPEVIAEYVAYFAAEALTPHFNEEETNVLGCLPDSDALKKRTLDEHEEIVQLIQLLPSSDQKRGALLELATKLDDHIRFEERELFPYLENLLDPEELAKIGAAIDQTHQPFVENYPLEFWKKSVSP